MPIDYSISGLVPAKAVVTPREAAHRQSTTHVRATAKTAIMRYLGRFFDEDGNYRQYTKAIFPDMLKYVTNLDFVPDSNGDADNRVKMPIIKYYNEVKASLPCIVISESGITARTPGLGFDQGAYRAADKTVYRVVHIIRQVSTTISVVSNDQATTDSIVDVLALAFGELSGFTTGMSITDDSADGHWIVRFPKIVEPGSSEKNQQGDDPKDLVWTSQTNLVLDFEDSFLIPFEETKSQIFATSKDHVPTLSFQLPSVLRVGRETPGFVHNLERGQIVSCSDPSILVLKRGQMPNQYYLIGRKPGIVTIRVMDGTTTDQPGGMVRPNITNEFQIKVQY